jgi:hypothetical protein
LTGAAPAANIVAKDKAAVPESVDTGKIEARSKRMVWFNPWLNPWLGFYATAQWVNALAAAFAPG